MVGGWGMNEVKDSDVFWAPINGTVCDCYSGG